MIPRHTSIPQIAAAASRDGEQSARLHISMLLHGQPSSCGPVSVGASAAVASALALPIATYTCDLGNYCASAFFPRALSLSLRSRRPRCRAARRVFLDAALSSRCIRQEEQLAVYNGDSSAVTKGLRSLADQSNLATPSRSRSR